MRLRLLRRFLSLEKECAAYYCSSRSNYIQNNERKPAGNNFFHFPKEKFEIRLVQVNKTTGWQRWFQSHTLSIVCPKHFLPSNIKRPSRGTRHSLKKGSRPIPHDWITFEAT